MPLFEFECSRCDLTFEELIRSGESAACPTCGTGDVHKIMSTSAVRAHSGMSSLPVMSNSCPPSNAPPCGPACCRLP